MTKVSLIPLAVFLFFFIAKSYGQGPEIKDSGLQLTLSAGAFSTSLYVYECGYGIADWKDVMTEDVCGEVVWSGFPDSSGCIANNTPLAGKMVMLWEGGCPVAEKAKLAQEAGALGILVVGRNNTAYPPVPRFNFVLEGQLPAVRIPVFYVKASDFPTLQPAFEQNAAPIACLVRPGIFINSVGYPTYDIQQQCTMQGISPYQFSVRLSNISGAALQNITLQAILQKNSGEEIASSVQIIPAIAASVSDSLFLLPDLFTNLDLPPGLYQVVYSVQGTAKGQSFLDTRNVQFKTTGALLAKELHGTQSAYRPDTLPESSWGLGNIFYYNPPLFEYWYTTYAEISVLPAPEMNSSEPVVVYVSLFQLNEGIIPGVNNFAPDGSDMTMVGTGSIEVMPSELNNTIFIELIDLLTANIGVPLEPGRFYALVVAFEGENIPMYVGFNEDHVENKPGTLIFKDNIWTITNFYGSPNAVIRMIIDSPIFCPTVDTKSVSSELAFKISPNPASDILHIQTGFEESTDAIITFTNISGKIILTDYRKNLNVETLSYPVEQLPTGVYAVRILTKEASGTQKFVVHKE